MSTLFISDLHLDDSRPEVTAGFFQFLKHRAAAADALYILGDFFEVWLGDDDDTTLANTVIAELHALTLQGVKLYIMHGNRDFLLGEDFCRRTGATLLPDPTVVTLYGHRTLLMHGDSLCTRDQDYMAFRQQARSTVWQQQLLAQPLEERRLLAQQIRQQSKAMNSLKAEDIMDVTPSEVKRVLQQHNCRLLIHGHTHRPAKHSLTIDDNDAERWVLGDWHDDGWVIEVSSDTDEHNSTIHTIADTEINTAFSRTRIHAKSELHNLQLESFSLTKNSL